MSATLQEKIGVIKHSEVLIATPGEFQGMTPLAATQIQNAIRRVEPQHPFHYVHFPSCEVRITDKRGIRQQIHFIKEGLPPVWVNMDHTPLPSHRFIQPGVWHAKGER